MTMGQEEGGHFVLQNLDHIISHVFIHTGATLDIQLLMIGATLVVPKFEMISIEEHQFSFHLFAYIHRIIPYLVVQRFHILNNTILRSMISLLLDRYLLII